MSRYTKINSVNLKFEQFIDIMLNSGVDRDTVKRETKNYVEVLETSYNDKIQQMQIANKRLKQEISKLKTSGLNEVVQKKDME